MRGPYAHREFDKLWLDFREFRGYIQVSGTLNYLLIALVCSEMDTAIFFERSLWTFWPEVEPHFTLRLIEWPRPPCAHRDFDQLTLDFTELGGYFPVPGTLN